MGSAGGGIATTPATQIPMGPTLNTYPAPAPPPGSSPITVNVYNSGPVGVSKAELGRVIIDAVHVAVRGSGGRYTRIIGGQRVLSAE